jgi:hypothetical protein
LRIVGSDNQRISLRGICDYSRRDLNPQLPFDRRQGLREQSKTP